MPSNYIQAIAEKSSYLSYWYSNVPANIQNNINSLAHLKMQEIGRLQLEAFKARQAAAFNSLNGGNASTSDIAKLGEIFDTAIYQEGLNNILEPIIDDNGKTVGATANYGLDNIEQAVAELKSLVNNNNVGEKLSIFSQEVTKILENTFQPENGTIQDIAQKMFLEYAKANVSGMSNVTDSLSAAQTSRTVKHIINSILAKENRQVFDVNLMDKSYGNMTRTIKKMLLVVAALPNFEATGMKSAYVRHGDSSKRTRVNGENEILDELAAKVYKAAEWMRAMGAEISVRKAAIDGNIPFLEKIVELNAQIDSFRSSSKWFDVDVDIQGHEVYQRILNELKQTGNIVTKQVSKADTGFTITSGSVTGNLGFSVKAGQTVQVNSLSGKVSGIHLQSSTPLSTLLFREIGLSSANYFGVLQLLAAHDDVGGLDGTWDEMKEKLTYLAAINTLMGSSVEGQALFMVLDGRVLSMGNILADIFNSESSTQMIMNSTSKNGYGLNRGDYVALNSWIGDGPNVPNALNRSSVAWNQISNLLYATKINIILNIQNVFSLV